MTKVLFFLFFLLIIFSCNNAPEGSPDRQVETNVNSNVVSITCPADSVSAEPYLFTDKEGIVYFSWIEKSMGNSVLKFSFLEGETWAEPQVISSGSNWFVNWADYPLLAANGNDLIAHYLEKSDQGKYSYDIKLTTSNDRGKTWSQPAILHDDGKKAEHGFVSVVPNSEGYFISWLDGRNAVSEGDDGHGHHGQMTMRAATIDRQGKKTGEWELDGRVCDCCQTSAALTSTGPLVVYRDRSEDETRDISIVRMVNGQWTKPKPVFSDHWKIDGCPVNGPRIAAQGNTIAVAWFTSPDKKGKVQVIFSKDGGETFGEPIRMDEGKTIGRVALVLLDENSALITWMEGNLIKAARVFADGRKDPSITIATSSEARSSGFPQVTKKGKELIFAWTDEKERTIKMAKATL